MALFLHQTDFRSVLHTLYTVGYSVLMVFPITALAYYLGTLSWQVYLKDRPKKVSTFRLFFIRQIGETVGLFNPTSVVGGDLTKIYYLLRLQISERSAANSVVSSRMTMVLSQVLLSTLALLWLLYHIEGTNPIENTRPVIYLLLIALTTIQIALFYWIYRSKGSSFSFLKETAATTKIGRYKNKIVRTLSDLKTTFRSNKKAFFLSYLFALLHWIVGSLEFYLILSLLGINIAMMQSVLMDMGVILIKSVGAFIPGQIGIEELGNKVVLAAIGVQSVTMWISISLLRRFRQLIWAAVGCIAYVFFTKQSKPPYALSK
ncbi:flippase-like domain-containing protein [Sphingobacterium sp. lm-10]|nr:flippase-like domain-containing protein [Sphingobacterium sp. lm-10]